MEKDRYVAYVGTYTHENSLGIHIYDLDVEHGTIAERKMVPIRNSSDLIISNSGEFLYSIADEGVEAFHILDDGDLRPINKEWIGGMRGCYLDLDEKDRYLFVAGYHDARVSMMRLNADGSIAGIADGTFHKGMGRRVADRNSRPHVHCVKVTPDQKFLCAVDGGLDHVKIYKIDYEKGKLINHDIIRCPLDSAPRAIRFSRDGRFAYVLCELTNEINVYSYYIIGEDNPEFELIQTVSTKDSSENEIGSAYIMEFSPNGKYIFCTDAGVNSVIIFEVDAESGKLTEICNSRIGGEFPKAIAVFPDGRHFMCMNHDDNTIGLFNVDYENRYFLMHGKPIEVETPNCVYIHKLNQKTFKRRRKMTDKYRLVTRSDFDGLVCAMILKELQMIDDIKFVHPKDMQDGIIPVTNRDITTNLPYVEGVHLAFDHHSSEVHDDEPKASYIIEGDAPSTARVVYNYFGGKEKLPRISEEIMAAVDKSDTAQFTLDEILHPSGWTLMSFLMDARTGLGRFHDFRISNYDLMMKLIDFCLDHSIEDVLELPDVKERVELYNRQQEDFKAQLQRVSRIVGDVVVLYLKNEETIYSGNRFLIYALYPEVKISVHVMWGFKKQNTAVTIGKSILNRSSDIDIGEICHYYGGGGHHNAGTCQLANDEVDDILPDILELLNQNLTLEELDRR